MNMPVFDTVKKKKKNSIKFSLYSIPFCFNCQQTLLTKLGKLNNEQTYRSVKKKNPCLTHTVGTLDTRIIAH